MKPLQFYWYQSSIIVWLLLPISWLYCTIVFIRKKLYQLKIKRSFGVNIPVIVIGNIVAGGSGKTPLLLSLCDYLKAQGFHPGIVSRGYGGNVTDIKQVEQHDSSELVGDEPLMIHLKTDLPVVVGKDRVAAVQYLVKNNQCDVILSDDGLQHYRMNRDFEIAVVDSERRYGNGFCLPAGPLREKISRLDNVDMVVYNGDINVRDDEYYYQLKITELKQLFSDENRPLKWFSEIKVHAVAGIGNPSRFFTQLRMNGLNIIEHAYPDHHRFIQEDFEGWRKDCIIMTDKDAVKCQHLTLEDAWVLSVKATFSDELESGLVSNLLPILRNYN